MLMLGSSELLRYTFTYPMRNELPSDHAPEHLVSVRLTPDTFGDYLRKIDRGAQLSAAEEVLLARQIEAGVLAAEALDDSQRAIDYGLDPFDEVVQAELASLVREGQAAKNRMIEANLALVVSFARRLSRHGMDFAEIVQQGNLGLIRAVEGFDYRRGYKFSTYAASWIRQAILIGVVKQARHIRLPEAVFYQVKKLVAVEARLLTETGQLPTNEALAEACGLTPARVAELRQIRDQEPMSLSMPLDEEAELADVIEDGDAVSPAAMVVAQETIAMLRATLQQLTKEERAVISDIYGLETGRTMSLAAIAKKHRMTVMQLCTMQEGALSRLRQLLTPQLEPTDN